MLGSSQNVNMVITALFMIFSGYHCMRYYLIFKDIVSQASCFIVSVFILIEKSLFQIVAICFLVCNK